MAPWDPCHESAVLLDMAQWFCSGDPLWPDNRLYLQQRYVLVFPQARLQLEQRRGVAQGHCPIKDGHPIKMAVCTACPIPSSRGSLKPETSYQLQNHLPGLPRKLAAMSSPQYLRYACGHGYTEVPAPQSPLREAVIARSLQEPQVPPCPGCVHVLHQEASRRSQHRRERGEKWWAQ